MELCSKEEGKTRNRQVKAAETVCPISDLPHLMHRRESADVGWLSNQLTSAAVTVKEIKYQFHIARIYL